MYEDAVHGGQLRPYCHGERASCLGPQAGSGRVRATVPVQRDDRYQYPEAGFSLANYPEPTSYKDLRETTGLRPLPPEWVAELRSARDTLCRLVGALGGCGGSAGCGNLDHQVPGSGQRGHGADSVVQLSGTTTKVGRSSLFGCYPVSETDHTKCTNWPDCKECGPPRL